MLIPESLAQTLQWACIAALVITIVVWRVLRRRSRRAALVLLAWLPLGAAVYFLVRGGFAYLVKQDGGAVSATRMRIVAPGEYTMGDGSKARIELHAAKNEVLNDTDRPVYLRSLLYSPGGAVPGGGETTIAPRGSSPCAYIEFVGPNAAPPTEVTGRYTETRTWLTW